jgi:Zn-dependent alcohol dehydrogenase
MAHGIDRHLPVWTETARVRKTGHVTMLREAIRACRKGGTVSVIGVCGGFVDKFPMGAVMNNALTIRGGQQHGQHRAERLFGYIRDGKLDPSWLLTHRYPLERGQEGCMMFKEKTDDGARGVRVRAVGLRGRTFGELEGQPAAGMPWGGGGGTGGLVTSMSRNLRCTQSRLAS